MIHLSLLDYGTRFTELLGAQGRLSLSLAYYNKAYNQIETLDDESNSHVAG